MILTEMIAVKGVTLVFYLQDKYLFKAYFKAGSGETRCLSSWSSQYSEGDKTKTHQQIDTQYNVRCSKCHEGVEGME